MNFANDNFPHNLDRNRRHSVPLKCRLSKRRRSLQLPVPPFLSQRPSVLPCSSSHWVGVWGFHTDPTLQPGALLRQTLPCPDRLQAITPCMAQRCWLPRPLVHSLLLRRVWFASRRRAHRGRTHTPTAASDDSPRPGSTPSARQFPFHHSFQFQVCQLTSGSGNFLNNQLPRVP